MTIFEQRKIIIISLAIYWASLIFFAHIPIPESVRSANVSDKSLHFLAYLVLTFLLWFSIKPQQKVNWGKFPVWIILVGLTIYGSIDEIIQSFVGRTCDVFDISANLSGIIFGLLLLTFLTFRPAALFISGIVIFAIANIAKANLAEKFPISYGVFHFFAYGIFTIFWLLNLDLIFRSTLSKLLHLVLAGGIPIIFLLFVRIVSLFLGKDIGSEDIIVPIAAILIVTGANYLRTFSNTSIQNNPR
jgi:VanZ family protein